MKRIVHGIDGHPDLQDFLKAMASETRQRVLFLFLDGQPRTVGQIAAQLEIVSSTASEHLAILKRGGLLTAERDGKEVFYRPDRARAVAMLKKLTEVLTACCPL